MVQIAVVAALYVIVTVVLGPLGSGAIQFRLSELFNFLAFYNKKYIWAVSIGCVISNYISSTLVDVFVGSQYVLNGFRRSILFETTLDFLQVFFGERLCKNSEAGQKEGRCD